MSYIDNIMHSAIDLCDEALKDNTEYNTANFDYLVCEQKFKQSLTGEQLKIYVPLESKLNFLLVLEKEQLCKVIFDLQKSVAV